MNKLFKINIMAVLAASSCQAALPSVSAPPAEEVEAAEGPEGEVIAEVEIEAEVEIAAPSALFAVIPAQARQAILVQSPDAGASAGSLRRFERAEPGAAWVEVGVPVAATLGHAGMAWGRGLHEVPEGGSLKQEGDGRSPAGVFRVGVAFGLAPEASIKMPYRPLKEGLECVDDPGSAHYNRLVDRRGVRAPDWSSAERMASMGEVYRWGLWIEHNGDPAVAGGGSCIFLHIQAGPGVPTVGCTAIEGREVEALLGWLDPAAAPVVVQEPLRWGPR